MRVQLYRSAVLKATSVADADKQNRRTYQWRAKAIAPAFPLPSLLSMSRLYDNHDPLNPINVVGEMEGSSLSPDQFTDARGLFASRQIV